jgi:hypothetical protein
MLTTQDIEIIGYFILLRHKHILTYSAQIVTIPIDVIQTVKQPTIDVVGNNIMYVIVGADRRIRPYKQTHPTARPCGKMGFGLRLRLWGWMH